jgi:hypothetical protein
MLIFLTDNVSLRKENSRATLRYAVPEKSDNSAGRSP